MKHMSNVKHPKCPMRDLANQAKARLAKGEYFAPAAPANITPRQREIFLKLTELKKHGEDVVDPIAQLADKKLLGSLSHDERQRYIIQLASDYVSVKNMLDSTHKKEA